MRYLKNDINNRSHFPIFRTDKRNPVTKKHFDFPTETKNVNAEHTLQHLSSFFQISSFSSPACNSIRLKVRFPRCITVKPRSLPKVLFPFRSKQRFTVCPPFSRGTRDHRKIWAIGGNEEMRGQKKREQNKEPTTDQRLERERERKFFA